MGARGGFGQLAGPVNLDELFQSGVLHDLVDRGQGDILGLLEQQRRGGQDGSLPRNMPATISASEFDRVFGQANAPSPRQPAAQSPLQSAGGTFRSPGSLAEQIQAQNPGAGVTAGGGFQAETADLRTPGAQPGAGGPSFADALNTLGDMLTQFGNISSQQRAPQFIQQPSSGSIGGQAVDQGTSILAQLLAQGGQI